MLLRYLLLICLGWLQGDKDRVRTESPEKLFEQADKHYQDGKNDEIIKLMTKLLERKNLTDKQIVQARSQRSRAYHSSQQYAEALVDAQDIVDEYPKMHDGYKLRARIYSSLNKHDRALKEYHRALDINPKQFDARCERAILYCQLNQFDEALADADYLSKNIDKPRGVAVLRLQIYLDKKDYKEVLKLCDEWSKKDTGDDIFILYRGHAEAELGNDDAALYAYREYYADRPVSFEQLLKQNDANYYLRTKRSLVQGLAMADNLIANQPQHDHAYYHRGIYHVLRKKWKEALADYDQALRLAPDQYLKLQIRCDRARVYRALKQYQTALDELHVVLKTEPEWHGARQSLAWYLATIPDERFRHGKKALEHAQMCVKISKGTMANDLECLAAAYAELGQFDEAVAQQKKAIEVNYGLRNKDNALKRLKLYQEKKPFRDADGSGA